MDSLDLSFEISFDSLDSSFDSVTDIQNSNRIENSRNMQTENTSKNDLIEQAMMLYVRHNLTLVCLEDAMKFYNVNREDCDKMPIAKKQIMKLFRENHDLIEIYYHMNCAKCNSTSRFHSESTSIKCIGCNNILKMTETNFFITLPIEKQIIQSVKENWKYITQFDTSGDEDSKFYSDVHDGTILKDALKQYIDSDVNILSLCLNLDGANKHKSNELSVWPIQLLQNYLPPNIRFLPNNIIVCGLYYNKSKPNCRDYLMPLVQELDYLRVHNISINIEDESFIFKPVVTHSAFDLPAKSIVQETKQYGGYNGCTFCVIPGELIIIKNLKTDEEDDDKKNKKPRKKNTKNSKTNNNQQRKFVRYVESDEDHKLRDEIETLKTMLVVSQSKSDKPVNGIKDVSCLVFLEHFNILFSIGVEYMHTSLLGFQKRMLNFFCNSKYKHKFFYLTPQKRTSLSNKILSIKPTSSIVRKPRSLDQRMNFKASEYRSMLLYYLPVCLPGLLPNEYVEHIRLLSSAVYTLLKMKISSDEVDDAEVKLIRFVKQHQELFGKENMVMVIHLHKHFAECVRHLGPLWSHSAFPFERNNGSLLKLVNGTTDVLHQMSTKYVLKKSLSTKGRSSKVCRDEKIFLGRSESIVEKYLKVLNVVTNEILDFFDVMLSVHKRVKLEKTIYTSLLYTRPKKSIDYFIGLKDETIGMAKFYFYYNGKQYVLLEEFEIIGNIYHIDRVQRTKNNIMAPIDEIEKKYIFMRVGLHQYIVLPPNPFENE